MLFRSTFDIEYHYYLFWTIYICILSFYMIFKCCLKMFFLYFVCILCFVRNDEIKLWNQNIIIKCIQIQLTKRCMCRHCVLWNITVTSILRHVKVRHQMIRYILPNQWESQRTNPVLIRKHEKRHITYLSKGLLGFCTTQNVKMCKSKVLIIFYTNWESIGMYTVGQFV